MCVCVYINIYNNSTNIQYKGKGDRSKCKNYRGINLLSIPGKVYGRVLIQKVRSLT